LYYCESLAGALAKDTVNGKDGQSGREGVKEGMKGKVEGRREGKKEKWRERRSFLEGSGILYFFL
jgi:hypothetical protein